MTRYSLTIESNSIHQWIRAIPGKIILVKQVNIHVYSIEKVSEFDGWGTLPRGAVGLSAVCDCGIP